MNILSNDRVRLIYAALGRIEFFLQEIIDSTNDEDVLNPAQNALEQTMAAKELFKS